MRALAGKPLSRGRLPALALMVVGLCLVPVSSGAPGPTRASGRTLLAVELPRPGEVTVARALVDGTGERELRLAVGNLQRLPATAVVAGGVVEVRSRRRRGAARAVVVTVINRRSSAARAPAGPRAQRVLVTGGSRAARSGVRSRGGRLVAAEVLSGGERARPRALCGETLFASDPRFLTRRGGGLSPLQAVVESLAAACGQPVSARFRRFVGASRAAAPADERQERPGSSESYPQEPPPEGAPPPSSPPPPPVRPRPEICCGPEFPDGRRGSRRCRCSVHAARETPAPRPALCSRAAPRRHAVA